MPVSRFLLFSLKNSSAASLNPFRRFVPSKRFHSSSYLRSARRPDGPPLLPEKTPSSHSWSTYIVPTALLGGIGGVAFFLHYNDERRAVLKGQGVNIARSAIEGPIIGGPFTLIDTEGRLVTERNLMGNWVLLYFGYTSSPDVGPAEVEKMAKNLKVLPVFVTIDPQRDTPPQLRAYLREFDSRIIGLTGPVAAIRQMAQEYRVYFKKVEEEGDDYLVESSHNMYLVNPNMEAVRCFGVEYSADDLSEAILKEQKKG
ncbi:protein SCO1 homolog 2, mitochondrial isoform X2 [Diospyros lotus]|uniref:protein SCO1 homolog 2, mitochondrial isoform X2 n=1 Tax=Diospyros lotus TaxID=55363 RepID=UPI00225C2499|nr:protein SCO1 homolog 2, mitochondrial isoform X2 [Diospyros lotus]